MTTSAAPPASGDEAAGIAGPKLPDTTDHGARAARRFVRWLLVPCLSAIALIAAVNWWLDPIGVTGRNTRFTSTQNGVVRTAKLDLMDDLTEAPDVLLLGSSRTMKVDPVDVENVSGRTAFNAGVSGGRTKDAYLYAAYAQERWGKREFPHLVIGVTNDVFHRSGDDKAMDDRLQRHIPDDLAAGGGAAAFSTFTQLASMSTTKASYRTGKVVVRRFGPDVLLHPEGETGVDALRGNSDETGREESLRRGMQVFDPGTSRFNAMNVDLRVRLQMAEFIRAAFKGDPEFTGVDEQGYEYMERLLKLANDRGDEPTLWITPYHPIAREMLPEEYDERDEKFRDALEQLEDDGYRFTLLDYEDPETFNGDDEAWFDGIHMKEPNTRRVVEQLERDRGL